MRKSMAVLAALVIGPVVLPVAVPMVAPAIGGLVTPAEAATPAQAQSPAPPADIAECLDGTCTVTVTGPVEIPLDGRAGYAALSVVDVQPNAVAFMVRRGASTSYSAVGRGGTATFGSGSGTLQVRVVELAEGSARLEITTTAGA